MAAVVFDWNDTKKSWTKKGLFERLLLTNREWAHICRECLIWVEDEGHDLESFQLNNATNIVPAKNWANTHLLTKFAHIFARAEEGKWKEAAPYGCLKVTIDLEKKWKSTGSKPRSIRSLKWLHEMRHNGARNTTITPKNAPNDGEEPDAEDELIVEDQNHTIAVSDGLGQGATASENDAGEPNLGMIHARPIKEIRVAQMQHLSYGYHVNQCVFDIHELFCLPKNDIRPLEDIVQGFSLECLYQLLPQYFHGDIYTGKVNGTASRRVESDDDLKKFIVKSCKTLRIADFHLRQPVNEPMEP